MIQMINLKKQFEEIREDVIKSLTEVIESSTYILGPKVAEFEKSTAKYLGAADALGVASGTDALHLALMALGIKEGDEVITTPFTFFATVESIVYVGARPVFVDIDPETFNIDPAKIEERITKRTKAIIPVHMFGLPAEMARINEIASRHNLKIVEDCAQSFGASIKGKMTGTFGDIGAFSFYPSKNLGAFGDAGLMTVARDASLAPLIKKLRNHGSAGAYKHDVIGLNSRLDEMQAAILLIKLKRIEAYNEARRRKAALYTEIMKNKVDCPKEPEGYRHVYHQYTIKSPQRDKLKDMLASKEIASTIYYPVPVHMQPAMSGLGHKKGDFPMAERVSSEVLSLPICPCIDDSDVRRIAEIIAGA